MTFNVNLPNFQLIICPKFSRGRGGAIKGRLIIPQAARHSSQWIIDTDLMNDPMTQ